MVVKNHKELIAWQKGMDLVESVYKVTAQYPKEEQYGLTSQSRRAAISIPSNIAEGHSRNHRAEYRQSVYIAIGSLAELETQLYAAREVELLRDEYLAPVFARIDRLRAMLITLGRKLA